LGNQTALACVGQIEVVLGVTQGVVGGHGGSLELPSIIIWLQTWYYHSVV